MLNQSYTQEEIQREQASFITKVYGWMSLALLITGITALGVAEEGTLAITIATNSILRWGLLLAQLGIVFWLSARIAQMSANTAMFMFLFYSFLCGITFSVIFLIFTSESIASTFFITAGTFAVMSAYGYFTKKDLTSIGNLCMMALIGVIIASVVNMFFNSSMLYWITTILGLFVFIGLTAYDTQKIKNMNIIGNEGTDEDKKEAIMGALTLYLDFINMFLMMLRLFGNRR